MTRQEIEMVLVRRLEAWRRRDAAAVAAEHSEDAVYESMLVGPLKGRTAITALYRSWFDAFPDAEFEVENQVIDSHSVAIAWTQKGRHMGEFCGLAATGRIFVLSGAFFFTFGAGGIVHTRSIYDITGLLVQIGVLKAKPGF